MEATFSLLPKTFLVQSINENLQRCYVF